jgi:integration host factor subunit alpha
MRDASHCKAGEKSSSTQTRSGRTSKENRMMRSVGTLTRADLAETINRKMGFSRAESLEMVEAILGKMSDALAKGENVKISGFGSFVLRDKNERIGRNPKTGVEVPITPRRVMTFRASQLLKERIAKG